MMGYEEELAVVETTDVSITSICKSRLDEYVFYVANKISLDEPVTPFDEWLEL